MVETKLEYAMKITLKEELGESVVYLEKKHFWKIGNNLFNRFSK